MEFLRYPIEWQIIPVVTGQAYSKNLRQPIQILSRTDTTWKKGKEEGQEHVLSGKSSTQRRLYLKEYKEGQARMEEIIKH